MVISTLAASSLFMVAAGTQGSHKSEIRAVHVGNPISVLNNLGDTWTCAWTDEGELYTPSNDTCGFGIKSNCNFAINRLLGDDLLSLKGETFNTMPEYGSIAQEGPDGYTWKSSGCISVGSALYVAIARHKYGETSGDSLRRQPACNASIIKSLDKGKTWVRSAQENYDRPMFPGSRFSTPYFVDYGKGSRSKVDQADKYIYAMSNNGFWDNGDDLVLGRVLRAKIGDLNAADWEYYAGEEMQTVTWSHDINHAKAIIKRPNHMGMTGATYIPAFGCYMMIGWYYPKGGGKMPDANRETVWDFYQSPKPWGPWKKVGSHTFIPQGFYTPSICLKFSANHGRRLFAVTAGDWSYNVYYRLTLVPLDLE